ncbi:ABC-2 family transporter protein [Microaerobacter geothermalis]|uniref:ABC transporter permease n=1 Tax=Microaerobacter geothermalis TaxID=674972 RepID=UPI001F30CF44|nr:ABC-2 family transporter protein [Microaerobacter geothermalis]MCF6095330.1 ABC-2 family transporter protein [Microaerobacter geothermalis]
MAFYFSVFWQYILQYAKTRLAYRMDILIEFISDLMFQAVQFIFIIVVFGHTSLLKGWTRDEVIFIYGFFLIPYALFSTFFNIWDFNERYIVRGEMDRILTRPVHSLFQIILETLELEALFGAVTGGLILWYSWQSLQLPFHWYDLLFLFLFAVGGALVYGGIFISLASIGFWSDSRTGIMPMMYNIGNYGRYPVDIYNRVIRFILTWILPFAFVGVYPASFFLGKQEWFFYSFLTPVVGILFFIGSIWLWNRGVRRYRGAGS